MDRNDRERKKPTNSMWNNNGKWQNKKERKRDREDETIEWNLNYVSAEEDGELNHQVLAIMNWPERNDSVLFWWAFV